MNRFVDIVVYLIFGVAIALAFVVVAGADIPGPTLEPGMVERYAALRAAMEQDVRAEQLIAVNGPYSAPDAIYHVHRSRPMVDTGGLDQWRTLAGVWFPPDKVNEALAIIWCESRGDPAARNPASSASGLWQFLKGWYSGRWSDTVGVFDPFDPVASMRVAATVSKNGSDWGDWAASRHCHGL